MKKYLALFMGMIMSATIAQAAQAAPNNIPTITIGWANELHTGNAQLTKMIPEVFADNPVHLKPISSSQFELIKDGEVIAYVNHVQTKGAAESATLMSQGHMQMAYCSSTALITAYDAGTDVKILCPIQSDGVAIAASIRQPYNTFEELVAYAKKANRPVVAGYHSAVSSPRIVLEYALKDAGLKVTENPADYSADVLMIDLKGLANLVPSLASGQADLWAGPAPNPQNAVAMGVGKIIATLNDLPDGKWVNFPCCTFNVLQSTIDQYPEIVAAMAQVTYDIMDYAQNHKDEIAPYMSQFVGLEESVLKQHNIVYTTAPDAQFVNGMETYFDAMKGMGKITGRLADKSFDEVLNLVFDFSFINSGEKKTYKTSNTGGRAGSRQRLSGFCP